MSGDIWLENPSAPIAPHHRIILWLAEGHRSETRLRLAFNDPRKFGRVWLTPHPDNILDGLGPSLWKNYPSTMFLLCCQQTTLIKPW
jgi:formamidopyrimidine-DNA glycosylase